MCVCVSGLKRERKKVVHYTSSVTPFMASSYNLFTVKNNNICRIMSLTRNDIIAGNGRESFMIEANFLKSLIDYYFYH